MGWQEAAQSSFSAISQLKSVQSAKQHSLSHLQATQYGNQILVAHEDDAFQVRGAFRWLAASSNPEFLQSSLHS